MPLFDGNAAVGSARTRRDRILSEQVRLVYTHAFSGLLVTLAGALLLAVVLWPAAGHARLELWLGVMVPVLAGCYALVRSYRRATDIGGQAS